MQIRLWGGEDPPRRVKRGRVPQSDEAKRAYRRAYERSERGKAVYQKWEQSEKGKAWRQEYEQSGKRKAVARAYTQSEKGKARRRAYMQSEKGRTKQDQYRQSGRRKDARLKNLYDITHEEYIRLYEEQNGCCAICELFFPELCIDHNHKIMKIRQLLCSNCNKGLGFFKDNPEILYRALRYIIVHKLARLTPLQRLRERQFRTELNQRLQMLDHDRREGISWPAMKTELER